MILEEAARPMETHSGSSLTESTVLLSALVTCSGMHPAVCVAAADLQSGDGRCVIKMARRTLGEL